MGRSPGRRWETSEWSLENRGGKSDEERINERRANLLTDCLTFLGGKCQSCGGDESLRIISGSAIVDRLVVEGFFAARGAPGGGYTLRCQGCIEDVKRFRGDGLAKARDPKKRMGYGRRKF